MYKKIGILTGGGDAPGLNAVIRAAVRTAIRQFGMEVVGIEDGAGRRRHGAGRGRRLPLGLADGRSAPRLAAGGIHLLVLRRVLRRRIDGVGEGIAQEVS